MSPDVAERVRALPSAVLTNGDTPTYLNGFVNRDAVLDLLAESTPAAPDEQRVRDLVMEYGVGPESDAAGLAKAILALFAAPSESPFAALRSLPPSAPPR